MINFNFSISFLQIGIVLIIPFVMLVLFYLSISLAYFCKYIFLYLYKLLCTDYDRTNFVFLSSLIICLVGTFLIYHHCKTQENTFTPEEIAAKEAKRIKDIRDITP